MCTFLTDTGLHVPSVTAAQMREVDRVAVEGPGPNLFQMMENAGRGLALAAAELLGAGWRQAQVVILAGTGGNGGGGITAARHLASHGARVTLVVTDRERLRGVPAAQLRSYAAIGGELVDPSDLHGQRPGLILDALIGYSLAGAPRGVAAEMIDWANGVSVRTLSLDVPSGIDATTGEAPGVAVAAEGTLTLALPKTDLRAEAAGALVLADIGIPADVYRQVGIPLAAPLFDGRYRVPLTRCAAAASPPPGPPVA